MWLASLRRFVFGNSHSRKERRRLAARERKRIRPALESLEERLTPSGGQTAGSYSALVNAIAVDTAANTNYVIDVTNNFTFNSGGQITISKLAAGSTLTIEGQNGTNYTLTGNGNRLFDIAKNQTVTLEDLTLTGGNVTTTAGPALGGAVYNSGNLTMKSVAVGGNQASGGSSQSAKGGAVYNIGNLSMKSDIVGGNQADGGSSQNAEGGGIYSSGGSLTLSHDLIGRSVGKTHTTTLNYKTYARTTAHSTKTIGASNKAASGSGGSALGGGLFVAGGTVNVSKCTIAGNQDSGSVYSQGGGLYVAGVASLNLTSNVIGSEKDITHSSGVTKSGATVRITSTETIGSANKALGGNAMGGGLYVSGGTVKVSQGVIGGNQAIAGKGQNAAGGGMFSTGAALTLSHVVIGRAYQKSQSETENLTSGAVTTKHSTDSVGASNKAASGSGGSAQGGGLYVAGGGTVKVSNCTIAANQLSGSLLAQGGGLYVSGVSQLNLTNDVVGHTVSNKFTYLRNGGVTASSHATALSVTAKSLGNANKAVGGNVMGGGLYVSGGTVSVSQGGIGSNQAIGGTASTALGNNGGNAQGGGIYVNNANLTLTGAVMSGDVAEAGNGGKGATGIWVGGTGGNAQGGVIFATNSTVAASGTTISGSARPGNGGTGATGTSKHLTGGTGGEAGAGQGGGVYIKGGSLTLKNSTEVSGIIYHGFYGPGNYYNQIMGAQGGKGGTGYNVTSGVGGVGGQGNTDEGGGVFASGATVVMETGASIQGGPDGAIHAGVGGQGGRGKTGGQGGVGGTALGGGMFAQGGSVSISGANSPLGTQTGIYFNSINQNNQNGGFPIPLNGGTGGAGGSGTLAGNGGKGGDAYGGGLYALSTSVTLNNGAVIDENLAYSGQGGSGANGITGTPTSPGGNGGIGGAAGVAIGGGAYLGSGVGLQINTGLTNPAPVEMSFNGAIGGFGGFGGAGGRGGQKLNAGIKNPTTGQSGGNGGNAGAAGAAFGGGLYVDASSNTAINLNNAQILYNSADGGEGGFAGNGGTGSYGSWAGGNGGSGGVGGSAVGAGVYVHEGVLSLTDTTIEGNISQGGKGGPGAAGGAANGFTVKEGAGHSGIAGNGGFGNVGGAAQGGGLYANATTVALNTSIIDGNGSYGGKGGQGGYGGVTYIHRVNGSGFDRRSSSGNSAGNGAAGQGGGVFATGNTTLTALNSDLSGNAVDGGAGGTGGRGGYYASYLYNTGGNGGIGGSAGNGAVGQGGGAYVNGGAFTLVNTTVADNHLWGGNGGTGGAGGNGSDGHNYGGSGGAGGNGGNAAPASGGGVYATATTLKLVNDTVANNTVNVENGEIGGAGGKGGAGGNAGSGQAYPTKASRQGVGGNAGNGGSAVTGQGGGLYLGGGSLSLLNATFAYNTVATAGTPGAAGTPGKGIFNNTTTPPTRLTADGQPGTAGVTIGKDQYGGLYVASTVTTASLENTIIALNTATIDNDASATFSSSDHDFIGDGTGFSATTSNGDSVGQYTNAQLTSYFGQLGSNGGPTQTIVPYATSPTIGAGDPNAASAIASAENISNSSDATDQRGLPRLAGGKIDIGSTELQVDFTGSPSVTTVQAGQTGQTITYTMNLTNGEGEPLNVTLTDVVPGGTTYNSNSAGGSVYSSGSQSSWTTITQPSATNSNTLTATATLNPGATATLTFEVTVLPTASGTITDNADLGWTGTVTNTTGSSSVAMNTTVSGGVSTTTTNLTTSGSPSAYGQSVTFQAAVSGSGTPTGEVVFEDGNTILAKETLSSGVATFTTSALAVGSHNITAIYCGDTNDSGSKSNTVTQVVAPDSTTTTLASMPVSSVYGQSVNLTATVSVNSPGAGTPTGKVTFYDGKTNLGTSSLNSSGVATLTTSALPVGNDSLTAVYVGDTNDVGSTSKAYTQGVEQDSTTTTLAATQPSVYGQPVTFTATVGVNSPGAGTPTGTVTFYDGNTSLGTGTLNSSGVATYTTSTLPVGSDSITAVYGGDTNDQASPPSAALSQTVNKDSTTTALTSSASSPVYGQAVTFTATVSANSPGSGTPTGTVTFYDGATVLGTGTLNSSGVATFTTSSTAPLPVGTDSITAVYSGDANYLTSTTSSALSQVVNQDQTTTSVTSSANPAVLAQNVTLTATVSVVSPGAGTPTGTVTFYDGSTLLGTGTLNSSGVATLSLSSLPVGNNNITAVYSGDTDDLGSTSNALAQQVQYHFGGFLPPLSSGLVYEINRTIPIKFTLSDYNGNAITSLSAVTSVQIQELDSNGNPIGSPFTPVSTNNQGLVYTGGHYQYNWQTKGLSAGTYEIEVALADGTTQTITIILTANGSAAGLTAGSSGGAATAGALLGGEVDLYVDNSDGDLTSDELARIQDAINTENAVIEPYGVMIVTVTDPTLANATLSMNSTSSLGGVAQGVLGCTSNADQVILIQGWNWYAGSDPTQIGSGQYDFETAAMHELGHVLGLGHSSSTTSVMYASLSAGTANRNLTTADLNVSDGGGSDGLHAVAAAPASGPSSGSSMTPPSIPSANPPANTAGSLGSGSRLSLVDQVFADIDLFLSDSWNAYQSEMSSMSALRQQVDALALKSFDMLLGFQAGAMGLSQDTLIRTLLTRGNSSSGAV